MDAVIPKYETLEQLPLLSSHMSIFENSRTVTPQLILSENKFGSRFATPVRTDLNMTAPSTAVNRQVRLEETSAVSLSGYLK